MTLPREHHHTCRVVHFAREVTFTPSQQAAVRFLAEDRARSALLGALTAGEREVLGLLTTGASNADIAARLGISLTTVRNHVAHILAKLHVHSRLEAQATTRDWLTARRRRTGQAKLLQPHHH